MNDAGLQPGDEVKCPNCGKWHAVYRREADIVNRAHPYAATMLYFKCPGAEYFAGPKLESRTKGADG